MSCNSPEAEGLLDFDPNDRSGAKVATAAHQFGGEKKRSSHWAIDHFHDRRHQHGFQSHGRALTSAHRNFLNLFELCKTKMTWMYIEVMQGRYKPFRAPSNQYEAMFNSGTSLKRLNESHTSLRTTARFWYRCPSLLIDDHRFSWSIPFKPSSMFLTGDACWLMLILGCLLVDQGIGFDPLQEPAATRRCHAARAGNEWDCFRHARIWTCADPPVKAAGRDPKHCHEANLTCRNRAATIAEPTH